MSGPVLVTGAAGFAGSHLVEHLASHHTPAVGTDHHNVDLLDRDRVRAYIRDLMPSAVYHCAGAPHVAQSWDNSAHAFEANVMATHHVLDAIRRAGLRIRVLIPGSSTVYAPSAEPLTERHPIDP